MIQTVSIMADDSGLAEVVKQAVILNGQGQKAPYTQVNINLRDK